MSRSATRLPLLLIVALCCAAPARALAQDDEDEPLLDLDEGDESDSSNEESTQTDASGEMAEPDGDAIDEGEEEEEPADEDDESDDFAPAGRSVAFRIGAGLGAGTLSFKRPSVPRPQRLPESAFAAAALELHLQAYPDDSFSIDFELEYQTSLGFVVQIPMLFALPQNVNARMQHVALSAAPMFRLGDQKGSPTLVFPIGFGFDAFVPEVDEYGVLEYSLGGPFLRAELRADLGESIGVRLGPELQWIVLIDDALRNEQVCCQGVAVGAEGSIEARIGSVLRVSLAYRESHASLPSARYEFSNVTRFLTARIAGAL